MFVEVGDGASVFHAWPKLETADVQALMQVIRVRVLRYLVRSGIIEDADQLLVLDGELADREPALAALARVAVSGLAPAGPERRDRPPVVLSGHFGVEVAAALSR